VSIDGLSATMVDVLLRVRLATGDEESVLLRGGNDSHTVAHAPTAGEVARSYVGLGVEHILLGVDHLLFVLGLMLVLHTRRTLVLAITAFTVAHSITLALASLGVARIPQAPVEAVIALSLVFLAAEILRQQRGQGSWVERNPWGVSFVVGLLHGLGFAGALREVGLPQSAVPLALLSFNVGVELGQLSFVAVVLLVLAGARRLQSEPVPRARYIAAYTIGSLAAFWVFERSWAFV